VSGSMFLIKKKCGGQLDRWSMLGQINLGSGQVGVRLDRVRLGQGSSLGVQNCDIRRIVGLMRTSQGIPVEVQEYLYY